MAVERLRLRPRDPWWGEHRSRYRLIEPLVNDKRVLDIACGTGFGVLMLADAGAEMVVGADVSAEAVVAASREYGGDRRWFLAADGTRLPFADGTFDLVTSFETLEHIQDGERFVAEIRRVVRADGLVCLSTPNRAYTEANGQRCSNPFHVREYSAGELQELLSASFAQVRILGQRLSPEYRISPFYADQVRFPPAGWMKLRLFWWKAQNRLPFVVKDRLSRIFSGHPFYPGEEHYQFLPDVTEAAPVLVAECRP